MKLAARRDGRVAEGARLESVYTLTGIGGSNPSLSASSLVCTSSEIKPMKVDLGLSESKFY